MVRKEEKPEDVKVLDGYYVFPDGVKIPESKVDAQVHTSRLNEFEKEQIELTAGKKYDMIIAEGLHRKILAEREEEKKRTDAMKARWEAERQMTIRTAKKMFDEGALLIIHDGKLLTALEPLPNLSDDDWVKIFNYSSNFISHIQSEEVKGALSIISLEKKFPGYRFILIEYFKKF